MVEIFLFVGAELVACVRAVGDRFLTALASALLAYLSSCIACLVISNLGYKIRQVFIKEAVIIL